MTLQELSCSNTSYPFDEDQCTDNSSSSIRLAERWNRFALGFILLNSGVGSRPWWRSYFYYQVPSREKKKKTENRKQKNCEFELRYFLLRAVAGTDLRETMISCWIFTMLRLLGTTTLPLRLDYFPADAWTVLVESASLTPYKNVVVCGISKCWWLAASPVTNTMRTTSFSSLLFSLLHSL